MRESSKQKYLLIGIYTIIIVGILVRVLFLFKHFTHCDDICVASYLFDRINKIDSINFLQYLYKRIRICFGFMTYAPLQIIFTSFLISENFSYHINLVLGRLPSLLCGVLSIVLFAKLILFRFRDNKFKYFYTLLTVALISFSWENIIYSAQMEPYEIIVLFGIVILYALNTDILKDKKTMLLFCFLFIVGCYAHYQFYYILFAFYASFFIDCIFRLYDGKYNSEIIKVNVNKIKTVVKIGFINLFFILPGIYFFFKTGMLERSVNWNAGNNMMFLYDGSKGIIYTLKFFLQNIIILVRYFWTVSDVTAFSIFLSITLVILSIFGLINLYKKRVEFIFYILLYGIVFLLILVSKLMLGPSRHFLFIFPFFIYLVIEGLDYLNNIKFLQSKINIIFGIMILINVIMFICFFNNEYTMRKDYANEREINNLVREYDVDAIYFCYDYSSHQLFKIENFNNMNYITHYRNSFFVKNSIDREKNEYKVMIVNRHQNFENFILGKDNFRDLFIEYVNHYLGLDTIDKYKMLYRDEFVSNYEIEYDSKDYWNYPNGKHLYIVNFLK